MLTSIIFVIVNIVLSLVYTLWLAVSYQVLNQFISIYFFNQTDDCLLLKIYQGWIFRPDDIPPAHYQQVHLQVNKNEIKEKTYNLLYGHLTVLETGK